MNTLTAPNPVADLPAVIDLNELLTQLSKVGRPSLMQLQGAGGWHCGIEIPTTTTGAKINVSSTFDHVSPLSAARQCAERVKATLDSFSTPVIKP